MIRVADFGMSEEYRDSDPLCPMRPCEIQHVKPHVTQAQVHTSSGSLIAPCNDSLLSASTEPLSLGIEFGAAIRKELYASTGVFAHKSSDATTATVSTNVYSSTLMTTMTTDDDDDETCGMNTPQGREGTPRRTGSSSTGQPQSAVGGSPKDFCPTGGDNERERRARSPDSATPSSPLPMMQTPVQLKRDVTAEALASILETTVSVEDYGIGNAKSIQQLADEIACGDSSILYFPSSMSILRVVQPVFVKLRYCGHILVNTKDVFIDDNSRIKVRNSLLGEKMHSRDASAWDAALRGIGEELGIAPIPYIEKRSSIPSSSSSSSSSGQPQAQQHTTSNLFRRIFPKNESTSSVSFCTKSSPSYPGLTSLYQTRLIEFNLRLDSEFEEDAVEELRKLGLSSSSTTNESRRNLGLTKEEEVISSPPSALSYHITDEEFTSNEFKSTGTVVHHWRWITEEEAQLTRVVGLNGL